MRANGVSFRHAVELLRADHLPLAAVPIQPVKHGTVRKTAAAGGAGCRRPGAADAGCGLLQRDVEAVAGGAEVSGIARPEVTGDDRPLQAGFANRTLGYRLPAKNRAAGAEMRGRLQAAWHPARERARALQRSVVIPVFNPAAR